MLRRPLFWIVAAGLIVIGGAGAFALGSLAPDRPSDRCDTSGLGADCTDLTPDEIERVTGMNLPEGTTIEESRYSEFQDWHLAATFVVPSDGVAAWEASLEDYTAQASVCTGLEGRGHDRACAEAQPDPDKGTRRYTRADLDDGSVVVQVEAFAG